MEKTKNYEGHPVCHNCKPGSLHCMWEASPCYGEWCGIVPGTGPWYDEDEDEKEPAV